MGFSRQEYWSGYPFPYLGYGTFLTQGSNPGLQADSLLLSHQGSLSDTMKDAIFIIFKMEIIISISYELKNLEECLDHSQHLLLFLLPMQLRVHTLESSRLEFESQHHHS